MKKIHILVVGYNSMMNIERCIESIYIQQCEKSDYTIDVFLNFSDVSAYNSVELWKNRLVENELIHNDCDLNIHYLDLLDDNNINDIDNIVGQSYIEYLYTYVYKNITDEYDYTFILNSDSSLWSPMFLSTCINAFEADDNLDCIDLRDCYVFTDPNYNEKPEKPVGEYMLSNILSRYFYKTSSLKSMLNSIFNNYLNDNSSDVYKLDIIREYIAENKKMIAYRMQLSDETKILYRMNQFNIINLIFKKALLPYSLKDTEYNVGDIISKDNIESVKTIINNFYNSLFTGGVSDDVYDNLFNSFLSNFFNFLFKNVEYISTLSALEDEPLLGKVIGDHDAYYYDCTVSGYNDALHINNIYINTDSI